MEKEDDLRQLFGQKFSASKLYAVYGDGESVPTEARIRLEALRPHGSAGLRRKRQRCRGF